jgi:hypothetical protein
MSTWCEVTQTTTSGATHDCPALRNRPHSSLRATTSSDCTCSSTMATFFPPSSSRHGVKFSAAAMATTLPTRLLPVKQMKSHRSDKSAFVSGTPPCITRIACGSRYFGKSFSISALVSGQASEGLMSTQLPALARAGMVSIAGVNVVEVAHCTFKPTACSVDGRHQRSTRVAG